MTKGGFDLLVYGTLLLVPFISLFAGRLQSLPVDFVGSSLSLILSFFDLSSGYIEERNSEKLPLPQGYIYNFAYIVLMTLIIASLCIWAYKVTQSIRREKNLEDGEWGGFWLEIIYWGTVIVSMILLIFAFTITTGYREIFNRPSGSEVTLFEFFSGLLSLRKNLDLIVVASSFTILLSGTFKYVTLLTDKK